ncbi:MAG: isopentenyl phosphate kinase [Nitrososphaera sp.]
MRNLALIKLGGSVVTFKDRPLTANIEAIDGISQALLRVDIPMVIVHGGGSFGHYRSVQYDMHTNPAKYDAHGVSVVHESMIALNQLVVNSMIRFGLNPYGLQPSVFWSAHRPVVAKIKNLFSMAGSNVLPVTFGDVVQVEGSKYSILSGDSLMTIIAKILRPSRVVFATNVDGIYRDLGSRKLIQELRAREAGKSIKVLANPVADVTGGMQRKITEAFKIASHGMDVMLVNGLYPGRIVDAAEGKPTIGSLIRKSRGRS